MKTSLVGIVLVVVAAALVAIYRIPRAATGPAPTRPALPAARPTTRQAPEPAPVSSERTSAPTRPVSAPAGPSDWAMFRGGRGLTGVAPGTLAPRLRRLWRFKTGGAVKSSAAVVAGRVYVGSNDRKVYCLRLADGGKLWEHKTGGAVQASPLVIDGRVFVGSADGRLYCLDAADGARKWTYETGGEIQASASYLRLGTPARLAVLVGGLDAYLHCVDASDGRKLWTCEADGPLYGAPAVAGDKVVFGGRDGVLRVVSAKDGEPVRAEEVGQCIPGSVAVAGGRAFVALYGPKFCCVELATGRVAWGYERDVEGFFSSPAVTDRRVLVGCRDDKLHCIDRSDGAGVWTFAARDDVDSSPVVCDGKVVFGSSDGRLYLVALADGEELWSYEIGEPVTASPAVVAGTIVIGSEDGYVYAFGPAGGAESD